MRIVRQGDRLSYEDGEIEFTTNSTDLRGRTSGQILDQLAEVLRQHPDLRLRIEGHTDSRGSVASNQRLSEGRADTLKAALVARGIAADRLSAEGHGETDPAIPEPRACLNKSEATVAKDQLEECQRIWTRNRRAVFAVTEGVETLPPSGSEVASTREPAAKPVRSGTNTTAKQRPDWALRLLGGYALTADVGALHGGHFGIAAHVSQRFGRNDRGYIGGGPRLHYRGVERRDTDFRVAVHHFGAEGNFLIGGGSAKVVGLFSLRLGLGLEAARSDLIADRLTGLGGWMFAGGMVLGKLSPRWSLGGHIDLGVASVAFAAEIGINAAWHFGRGRRKGI